MQGRSLDQLFEDMFCDRTPVELAAILAKYATEGNVLEAPKLIAAKAEDMLRHYVETVLSNGFKANLYFLYFHKLRRFYFHIFPQMLIYNCGNLSRLDATVASFIWHN